MALGKNRDGSAVKYEALCRALGDAEAQGLSYVLENGLAMGVRR